MFLLFKLRKPHKEQSRTPRNTYMMKWNVGILPNASGQNDRDDKNQLKNV